ncbi:MAG: hypothetical protein EP319_04610 [Deltaproteobacteria bacterium]|nr:MAG: hypothetical protein EP319_04610 [Deltaproteobacteria bacterium]
MALVTIHGQEFKSDPCSREIMILDYEFIEKNYDKIRIDNHIEKFKNKLSSCPKENIPYSKGHLDEFFRNHLLGSKERDYERIQRQMNLDENFTNFEEFKRLNKELNKSVTDVELFSRVKEQVKEKCSPVDLRKKFPKIRNQGNQGWCFAYSMADLAGFYLGKNVSAVDVALNHFNEERAQELLPINKSLVDENGGWPVWAGNRSLNKGFCSEDVLSKKLSYTNSDEHTDKLYRLLKQIEAEVTNIQNDNISTEEELFLRSCLAAIGPTFKELFPGIDQNTIAGIIRGADPNSVTLELINKTCKGKRDTITDGSFYKYDFRSYTPNTRTHRIAGFVDLALSKGDPVEFTHDPDIWAVTPLEVDEYAKRPKKKELHSSAIVGQVWSEENQSCNFIIRNSWGENRCKRTKIHPCTEDGYDLIPRSTIAKHTDSLTILNRQK